MSFANVVKYKDMDEMDNVEEVGICTRNIDVIDIFSMKQMILLVRMM
jgi:hypothetical protein